MYCKMENSLFLKLAMKGGRTTNTIEVNGRSYYAAVITYKSKLCAIVQFVCRFNYTVNHGMS